MIKERVISLAASLLKEAACLGEIKTNDDYEQALALMDVLVEDYDNQRQLIEWLASSIEAWENTADEFVEFNARIAALPTGIAVLRVLMEQYGLGVADLPEVGDKSLISRLLSGKRELNKQHIQSLAKRFKVSPALFFNDIDNLTGLEVSVPV